MDILTHPHRLPESYCTHFWCHSHCGKFKQCIKCQKREYFHVEGLDQLYRHVLKSRPLDEGLARLISDNIIDLF